MKTLSASFIFYDSLKDFIKKQDKSEPCRYHFYIAPSVKDAIESLGPPHTEIACIEKEGQQLDYHYRIRNGDQIEVFPYHTCCQTYPKGLTLDCQNFNGRFVLDVHLGKLAAFLRLAGFDCYHQKQDPGDHQLLQIALDKRRILLSRDIPLLKHGQLKYAYWPRNTQPRQQYYEVIEYFQLQDKVQPFKRCSQCNGIIVAVAKEAIANQLPEHTRNYYDTFWQCSKCKKIYWQGGHYKNLKTLFIDRPLNRPTRE